MAAEPPTSSVSASAGCGTAQKTPGCLLLACFLVHLVSCVRSGRPAEILWVCHMATAALSLGLLFRSPTLVGMGVYCLLPGTPLWISDVALGAPLVPTSILTHIAGWWVAVSAVRQRTFSAGLWWKTSLSLGVLLLVCRCVTPAELNINGAFAVYPRFAAWFPDHRSYLLALLAAMVMGFLSLERTLVYLRRTAFQISKSSIRP